MANHCTQKLCVFPDIHKAATTEYYLYAPKDCCTCVLYVLMYVSRFYVLLLVLDFSLMKCTVFEFSQLQVCVFFLDTTTT